MAIRKDEVRYIFQVANESPATTQARAKCLIGDLDIYTKATIDGNIDAACAFLNSLFPSTQEPNTEEEITVRFDQNLLTVLNPQEHAAVSYAYEAIQEFAEHYPSYSEITKRIQKDPFTIVFLQCVSEAYQGLLHPQEEFGAIVEKNQHQATAVLSMLVWPKTLT